MLIYCMKGSELASFPGPDHAALLRFQRAVADILRHDPSKVPSKVPDIDCSWRFMVLYLSKIPIIFM